MNFSILSKTLIASILLGSVIAYSGPSFGASRFHITVVGTAVTNEGTYKCDLAWSNQGNSRLDKPLKVEVRMQSGAIDRSFSGKVIVEEGSSSTTTDCPFVTPAGQGSGVIVSGSARLVKGVATFYSISATTGGTFPLEFVYKGLTTATTLIQLNAEPPGTPSSGPDPDLTKQKQRIRITNIRT